MLRFLPVPKEPRANILFEEFTDNDAMLDALRVGLAHSRIMLQAHTNRRTAAFIAFFDNWNVAFWPKLTFTAEDVPPLRQMFGDMRRALGYHLLRTIVGEQEEMLLDALLATGWQKDGVFRKLSRTQDGIYYDGVLMSFDDVQPPIPKEDTYEFRYGHVFVEQVPAAESNGNADADPASGSALYDPGALHAPESPSQVPEPGAELRPVAAGHVPERRADGLATGGRSDSGGRRPANERESASSQLCYGQYWP